MPRSQQQYKSSAPKAQHTPNRSIAAYTPPTAAASAKPSLGSILKESFTFGIGQATAFHAVNALLSPFSKQKETPRPCNQELTVFEQCLLLDNYSADNCQQEQKKLATCIGSNRTKLEEY